MSLSPTVLAILACPNCGGALDEDGDEGAVVCRICRARYPSPSGVPVVVSALSEAASAHKRQQIAFFDQDPLDEFGVTRPHGAPALYQWLLAEKFRRSMLGLEDLARGGTALTICAGSGLDAEFLARAGARVIASDISSGVLHQARERAERYRLPISLVAADAEALPFRDASVDIVYVHDGLHHLEEPRRAIAGMTRVARRAVSISEPADASLTSAAVKLGMAQFREEAGNVVRRLTLAEIVSELAAHGFAPVAPHRYAMYYRHWPGRAVRLLSRRRLLPLATSGFQLANRHAGRFGNKLSVQAIRVR
jgi:ubiquinone/menaquinone biosynthesis C-methylase UbiE/uncharacterized protein YbaR (Trm112 family)